MEANIPAIKLDLLAISEIAIIIIAVNKVLTIRYITKFAYSNLVSYIEYYYRKT